MHIAITKESARPLIPFDQLTRQAARYYMYIIISKLNKIRSFRSARQRFCSIDPARRPSERESEGEREREREGGREMKEEDAAPLHRRAALSLFSVAKLTSERYS